MRWFGKGRSAEREAPLEIDDLITLRRFEEAEAALRDRIQRNPRDLRSRLKLAETLLALGRDAEAVAEYLVVADAYADDGFHDKSVAALVKAQRLAPDDERVARKLQSMRRAKGSAHSREVALGALSGATAGWARLEVNRLWEPLGAAEMVRRLSDEQLRRLFSSCRVERFERGQVLAREGDGGSCFFLIAEGRVEASILLHSGRRTAVREFTTGDGFGEAALLEHLPWPADFRAADPTTVLALDRKGLEAALYGNADPRTFLDALRRQRNDYGLRQAVERLRES